MSINAERKAVAESSSRSDSDDCSLLAGSFSETELKDLQVSVHGSENVLNLASQSGRFWLSAFDLLFERRNCDDVAVIEPLCVETFHDEGGQT